MARTEAAKIRVWQLPPLPAQSRSSCGGPCKGGLSGPLSASHGCLTAHLAKKAHSGDPQLGVLPDALAGQHGAVHLLSPQPGAAGVQQGRVRQNVLALILQAGRAHHVGLPLQAWEQAQDPSSVLHPKCSCCCAQSSSTFSPSYCRQGWHSCGAPTAGLGAGSRTLQVSCIQSALADVERLPRPGRSPTGHSRPCQRPGRGARRVHRMLCCIGL